MLKRKWASAVRNVIQALKESEIERAWRQFGSGEKVLDEKQASIILQLKEKLRLIYEKFSDEERAIVKALGLDYAFENEWWATMFVANRDSGPRRPLDLLHSLGRNVEWVRVRLLPVVALLEHHPPDEAPVERAVDRLTMLLPENEGQQSKPERLIASLESITDLYRVLRDFKHKSAEDVVIVGLDSGSDKSFEIGGAPSILAEIRAIFKEIVTHIFFYREKKDTERLNVIKEALPLLKEISKAEAEKKISREEAAILKKRTIACVDGAIATGTFPEEMTRLEAPAAKELLAPQQKLLAPPPKRRGARRDWERELLKGRGAPSDDVDDGVPEVDEDADKKARESD